MNDSTTPRAALREILAEVMRPRPESKLGLMFHACAPALRRLIRDKANAALAPLPSPLMSPGLDAISAIAGALGHLAQARDLLRHHAPLSAAYVRRALKSTQGALNHARGIESRAALGITVKRKFKTRRP